MGKSLARFLADAAVDSDRLAGFLADPERTVEEAGLSRRDREALLSGDQGAVLARLQPTAEPVPAEPVDDRKENAGMWSWSSPMVDPAAAAAGSSWHYAAQAAGSPMWTYAPPSMWMAPNASWHQAPASFAAPPPMWTVSVVHVVHHVAGPPPPPPPDEHSGD